MSEYNFVTKFINCYNKNNNVNSAIQPKGKNQSKYADCEIIRENEIVKVEAKILKDTHSNSTNFYNLMGEIIGTCSKESLFQHNGRLITQTCVAFLIPHNSKYIFDKLWQKKIEPSNGFKYCSNFGVKYLISFDVQNETIRYFSYCQKTNRWV